MLETINPDDVAEASPSAMAGGMRSPLHYAGIYANLEMTRMLLDAGASSHGP